MQQETAAAGCNPPEQQPIAPAAAGQQGTDAVSGGSSSSSRSHLLVHQLMSAVSIRVQQLLDSAKANMTDSQLVEALCCAAADGCSNMVAALLAAGVPVNAADPQWWSALHHAAAGGHVDTVQVLLKAGADVGTRAIGGATPLYRAAAHGHLFVVRELLAAGAGCDARHADITPLQEASMHGHLSVVKALLAAGANVNAAGRCIGSTALHDAALGGHVDVVRELLAAGADPGVVADDGYDALTCAAYRGHLEVVQVLVAGGAVCSKQQWIRAAEQAVQHGQLAVVNALLAAPAEVQECTCLLVKACEYGQTRMVEYLLSMGLQSSLHSPGGHSGLAVATYRGHVDAVVLLLRASKQQAPTHAQVLDAVFTAANFFQYRVLAQLLVHLHKSGDNRVHDAVSASMDEAGTRMALLQGWAADAAQQQQQALVALEQEMAGSRPVVMGLLFAVQHPAVRAAAAQEAALP